METRLQPAAESVVHYSADFIDRASVSWKSQLEVPTLAVALAIFIGYGGLTATFRFLPLWIAAPLTALWLSWYGSFQHETIHNHPTGSRRLNALLGGLPLSLWIPYRIYRLTHRRHHRHRGEHLTEVLADPESFFLAAGTLAGYSPLHRWLCRANCLLAGRLVIGPALSLHRFWKEEARALWAGDRYRRSVWLRHTVVSSLLLLWLTRVCHIPVWVYFTCVVYPSIALSHLRSFTEHRADPEPTFRTVTVEAGRFWSLLFLNNNLHVAHHAHPDVSWYRLPALWRRMRHQARGPHALFEGGYTEVAQRHLLSPVIEVEHPAVSREHGRSR